MSADPSKQLIIIPDELNKPLAYYAIIGLKKAFKEDIAIVLFTPRLKSNKVTWRSFYKASRYIDEIVYADSDQFDDQFAEELLDFCENKGCNMMFPASEDGIKFVSKYRERISRVLLHATIPPKHSLSIALEKGRLAKFLDEEKLPTPKTFSLSSFRADQEDLYPIFVKPDSGTFGGHGIQRFETYEAFTSWQPRDIRYIVQQEVVGVELLCGVLCDQGEIMQYTIQVNSGTKDGFAPMNDRLDFIHNEVVLQTVSSIVKVLNWSGVADFDIIFDQQHSKAYIIEINPRYWGSLLGAIHIGVNFPYYHFLLSKGIRAEASTYKDQRYVKHTRAFKELLSTKRNYSLKQTGMVYFFNDFWAVVSFSFKRFIGLLTSR